MGVERRIFVAVLIGLATIAGVRVSAEDLPRPVTQIYRVGIGGADARSSYLSPLIYKGRAYSLSGEWSKASQWNPENLIMVFNGGGNMRSMLNPAHTASMIGLDVSFDWGVQWRRRLPYSLQVTAGGAVDVNGGVLYLPRNGNNPANALFRAGIDAKGSLSWKTSVGKVPVVVRDQVAIPTLGAFFSPQYGETYYEIYLGNHSGLAHFGWWGNNFGINNHLSVMLDFGRTAMERGYRYEYQSYWANRINTHVSRHSFTIGVIPHGLGIKRKANINSSIY